MTVTPHTPCRPVFVVGMNGSGTSMLLDSLGRHPELYALPDETLMMPYIIMRAPKFGDLRVAQNFGAFWQFAIDQMPALKKFNGGVKPGLPEDWKEYPRTVEGIFDGIFSGFAAAKGKRRWCEKTPDHVQHLPLLARTFPDARFIHIIRDGREVACSISRRQLRTPELVVFRWRQLVAAGQRFGNESPERYHELRYEALTADPPREMQRICEFLGVVFDERALQSRMPQSPARKQLTAGELGEIGRNPTKWPSYFDPETVRRMEAIGGKKLADLGYQVSDSGGQDEPSWIKRKWWRISDYARLMNRRRKTRPDLYSLPKLFRFVTFSLKQYRSKRF